MISVMASVPVIGIGFLVPNAAAQSDKYSKMALVEQYLMERNAEISCNFVDRVPGIHSHTIHEITPSYMKELHEITRSTPLHYHFAV